VLLVNPQTICDGQNAILSASGALSYSWNTGETTSSINVQPSTTTTYTVNGASAVCVATQTVQVTVEIAPAFDFTANILAGCPPLCIDFDDIVLPGTLSISDYSWNFGDGALTNFNDPTHCYTSSGLFDLNLSVTYSNGCVRELTKEDYINIFSLPSAAFTTNITSDPEKIDAAVDFTNLSSNASIYSWNFGDLGLSNLENPIHTYEQEGTYQVTLLATSSNGCLDSTKQDLIIKGMFTFYAPNAFTPNNDNSNEIFLPTGTSWDSQNYELLIFDRWGNEAFSTKDMNEGWNGKANGGKEIAQIDTYVWKVKLKDIYGYRHIYHGIVNVLR
jgi:gliding motility-associated-like protein